MVRADFPFFRDNPDCSYLDSGATTQKPDAVIEALAGYYRQGTANVHRAVFSLGVRVTERYEVARTLTARLLGAGSPEDIILTSGTTESLNLAAAVWSEAFLRSGDVIAVTALEHHSNLLPWRMAALRAGAQIVTVPVTPQGDLDMPALQEVLAAGPKLLAVTAVNNALGTVPPLSRIAALARRHGVALAVDAAQAGAHLPLDVRELGCTFLALSGHKMYAPEGSGALYIHPDLRDRLGPWKTGGSMVAHVDALGQEWQHGPGLFEAGTPNIGPQIAFAAALELLLEEGIAVIRERERALISEAEERLAAVPGVTVVGTPAERAGAVAFNLAGVHPHDVAQFLDSRGIAVRSGFHCAEPLFAALGLRQGACRASFGCYSEAWEIGKLAESLAAAREFFHGR